MEEMISAVITFILVILGVIGPKKWDNEKRGAKKITPAGWLILILGITSFSVTIYFQLGTKKKEEGYRKFVYNELDEATYDLLLPFYVEYKKCFPTVHKPNADPKPKVVSEQRATALLSKVSLSQLQEEAFKRCLHNKDVFTKSPLYEHGRYIPIYEYLAKSFQRGLNEIEDIFKINPNLSSTELQMLKEILDNGFIDSKITTYEHIRDKKIEGEIEGTVILPPDDEYLSDSYHLLLNNIGSILGEK